MKAIFYLATLAAPVPSLMKSLWSLAGASPASIQTMKAILYLAAALAVVGITLAAPAPAAEVAQESCWCEPNFRGERPRKSPGCCYP
ncbi:hypothetical protein CPB97_010476 [Podila verticillata]|nr:hypothetical protein CPB97_010476 [Podila verticillata]